MEQDNDGILYLELRDEKGNQVYLRGRLDDYPKKLTTCSTENFTEKGFRNAYRKNNKGSIHLITDNNHSLFQGNKSIQRACNIYLNLIPKFKQLEKSHHQSFDAIIRRFSHNLIKFQKRFKENFNRLVVDKARGHPYAEFKEDVKKRIETDINSAADDVCQMSHRAVDLDAQIETLRIIGGYADNTGAFLPTNLKKAMYRLTNPFVDELKKKNVKIIINIDETISSQSKVDVIHSLFNAAIWQIFDNASKYSLKDTDIEIKADLEGNHKKMYISMVSVSIEDDEREMIFLEGKQGKHVKKDQNQKPSISDDGSGIGLFIVRKALNFMRAKVCVINNGFVMNSNGYPYSRHSFIIEFDS